MTLIDQRILIAAPMQAVWQIVADHKQLPQWRNDVAAVSILSTRADGPGTRRRITPKNHRKDFIEEITVWYDGIGYEYRLIEGSPFKKFVSRIRLQGTPDGTIIQWTMTFEFRGLLFRLLRGRRQHRRLEQLVIDSLRELRRYADKQGMKLDPQYREKTRTKEAPAAELRAEYGARLIARQQLESGGVQQPSVAVPASTIVIQEPPARAEDTPSVPRVVPPSFLAEALKVPDLSPEPESQQDTRPTSPIILEDRQAAPVPEPEITKEDTRPKRLAALDEAIATPSTATPEPRLSPDGPDTTDQRGDLPPPTDKRDTGQIRIWDVFGMNPPKDELSQLIDELKTPPSTAIEPPPPSTALSATTDFEKKPPTPLDLWLAANEPPVPTSASSTISTLVRPPKNPRAGLRRLQRMYRLKLRRPGSKSQE